MTLRSNQIMSITDTSSDAEGDQHLDHDDQELDPVDAVVEQRVGAEEAERRSQRLQPDVGDHARSRRSGAAAAFDHAGRPRRG